MDILNKIISEHGSLNDLYYILLLNDLIPRTLLVDSLPVVSLPPYDQSESIGISHLSEFQFDRMFIDSTPVYTGNEYLVDIADDKIILYPATTITAIPSETIPEPIAKKVIVQAYQSILDICVQYYGALDFLPILLEDNGLNVNSYLQVNTELTIRKENSNNKVTNTLFALGATITNFDRDIKQESDIYLGTEDGKYIGPTITTKMKVT